MPRIAELFLFDIVVAIGKIEETIKNFKSADELKYNLPFIVHILEGLRDV